MILREKFRKLWNWMWSEAKIVWSFIFFQCMLFRGEKDERWFGALVWLSLVILAEGILLLIHGHLFWI